VKAYAVRVTGVAWNQPEKSSESKAGALLAERMLQQTTYFANTGFG